MKYLLIILSSYFLMQPIRAQEKAYDFEAVDEVVSLYPKRFDSANLLADLIARDFKSQAEQLRAGYSWLINNVSYDPQEYYNYKFQYRILEERNQKAAASREGMIERTLKNGIAVCEGYALTLERLCELLGINSYVVRGDTKTQVSDIGRPFKKNHMWNVAIVDGKPFLMDPTWGAGRYNGSFIKAPSYFYFKTAPEQFLNTHLPEVFADAYVAFRLSRENFIQRPLLIRKNLRLNDVSPKTGTLTVKEMTKGKLFRLQNLKVSSLSYSLDGQEKKEVAFEQKEEAVEFTIAADKKTTSLIIYVNDKPTIGYKIKK